MNRNLAVVLLFDNNEEVQAKLRRFFYEVQPSIFVGTLGTTTRNNLWRGIVKENIQASIIYQAKNDRGFIFKTTVEGSSLNMEKSKVLCTLFANNAANKPAQEAELTLNELLAKIEPSVSLMNHLLETGYIAEALMTNGRMHNMIISIANKNNIDIKALINSICFLCAVHDIGKAHPKFIAKMYSQSVDADVLELYNSLLERHLISEEIDEDFRHERFSRDIIKKYFYDQGFDCHAERYANLLAYHHQGKKSTNFTEQIELKDAPWLKIHAEVLDKISAIWKFDPRLVNCQKKISGITFCITSIIVLADWIASGSMWRELVDFNKDLSLRELADRFVQDHELAYKPMKERLSGISWDQAFGFEKNDMQKAVIEAAKDNPDFMIIEYPCGGGKTEAAVAAATILGKNKSGIFLATPTMATAKGMVSRMNAVAKRVGLNLNIPEMDSSILWSDHDMFKVPSYLWTSKTRHRILYPFAVGTVDQILKTILHYKYSCIDVSGLSDKVLIIDEIHAYDSYMLTELKRLILWCSYLDIPMILLSATLPTVTKSQLLAAAGFKDTPLDTAYPLITSCRRFHFIKQTPVACEGTTLKFNTIYTNVCHETFRDEVAKEYPGCTAFIERTVDDTYELFRQAKALGLNTVVFHGRDTIEHKEKKTMLLLDKLGKDRKNRPKNLTLVATSIIEQSLDIDLDRMITAIAPIDLLIQRFGRVWRHTDKGTIREKQTIECPLTIVVPNTFARLTHVYDTNVLAKTVDILRGRKEIDTVKDARFLIDSVYDSEDMINHFASAMRAGHRLIDSPFRDESTIVGNSNMMYSMFESNEVATREENYPTVSIALLDKRTLDNIDQIDYQTVKKIMQQKVVSISEYRCNDIHANATTPESGLLKTILLFDEEEVGKTGVKLTEDGLVMPHNNL